MDAHIDPLYNIESYAKEVKYRLQIANNKANKYLQKAKLVRKVGYDVNSNRLDVSPGDLVLVTNESRTKFDPVYKGPFSVVLVSEPNCTLIDTNEKNFKVHKNRLRKFYK